MQYPGFGYSVLRLFTGFARAARIAWILTVAIAIPSAVRPASPNTQACTGT